MASFTTLNINDFYRLSTIPGNVIEDMLNAGADVIVAAQREEIARQWKGPYSLGISAKSVKKGRVKFGIGGRRSISVYPQGTRKRGKKHIRNAEIAFINEFGAPKRNIRARPALHTAMHKKAEAAFDAEENVYDDFLNSLNL